MTRNARLALFFSLFPLMAVGCGGPPQIGADRGAFKAVDALYTAVSLKDARLVDRCEQDLARLRDGGKLPEAAAKDLESIIAEARKADWESAQVHLSDFMEGQRR